MTNLEGLVTVVTGASSGIGAATARRLATAGARVVIAARNEEKLTDLVQTIEADGGTVTAKVADVSKPEDVHALIQHATTSFGPVDVLVNNAGVMLFSRWEDTAVDDWNTMIDTNLRGYLNMIAATLPTMLERGNGRILNMSSVAAHAVGDASGVYSATKYFVRAITDSLRKEVGVGNGIQVSMVSPGVIDTGWADKVNDANGKEIAEQLNKGAIEPEAVADAVLYALDQPANVTVHDVVIHPTKQEW